MNEELLKATKEYQITHPTGEDAYPDQERAKKAQEDFLAGSAWEFLSAEGEPVDKAHLEDALKNSKQELQFFIREKGGDQNVFS